MTPLGDRLAARIRANGPITLYDYVSACLYDPDHGYYRVKAAVGSAGDFTTAPEISQIFGELIGLWAGSVWRQMGSPNVIRLVELGPGRGVLMADALRALKALPDFLGSATIHLVDTSSEMRRPQETALAIYKDRIFWHENFAEVPTGPAVVIANEFVDCLPVRQYVFDAALRGWRERMVTYSGSRFEFSVSDRKSIVDDWASSAGVPPAEGDILEVRPDIETLMQTFSRRETPFAALVVDYGSDRSGYGDTVQTVRRHRFAHVFEAPGEADITAHVNFAVLKETASRHRFTTHGPMPMGEWLLRMGAQVRHDALLKSAMPGQQRDLTEGVRRLIDPSQMGLLFKVLAMTNGVSGPPPPFAR